MIPHVITTENLTFVWSNEPYTFSASYPDYDALITSLDRDDEAAIDVYVRKFTEVLEFCDGQIYSKYGLMYIKQFGSPDVMINSALHTRISELYNADGVDAVKSILAFTARLYKNPDVEAINDMFRFLEHNSLPLTDDGYFLAYKLVSADYKDIYTGTMDNSVGKVVSMPRERVEFDRHKTCSHGLHFCSRGYLPHYGNMNSRIMMLKVDPTDVVSIPVDYNNAKGRACRYEVVSEIPNDRFLQETLDEVESATVTKLGSLLNRLKSFFIRSKT